MILALILVAIVFVLCVRYAAYPLAVYWATHDSAPEKKPFTIDRIEMRETPEWLYQILHLIQFGWNEWTEALNRKWARK
jgi:hypothetical protein